MIKFPKLHIAQSVYNRILNAADEINAGEVEEAGAIAAPSLPEAAASGQAIDIKLATPPPDVSAPPAPDIAGVLNAQSVL